MGRVAARKHRTEVYVQGAELQAVGVGIGVGVGDVRVRCCCVSEERLPAGQPGMYMPRAAEIEGYLLKASCPQYVGR